MASWSSPTAGKSGTDDVFWTEHFLLDFLTGRFSHSLAGNSALEAFKTETLLAFLTGTARWSTPTAGKSGPEAVVWTERFFLDFFVKPPTNSGAMV